MKAAMIIARVVACLLGAALASEEPAAQPSGGPTDQQQTTIARKTPELQAIERLNTWVVGLAGGQLEGAPIRFGTEAARVVDDGDNLCVLPIVTRGPVENVEALLYLKGVDAAINKDKGDKIEIEFVAYGAGLSMVRSDTSPARERLTAISASMKNVTFTGCGNTLATQSKLENKDITLVPEARLVPVGIARIVELEEQGWTYVRP